MPPRTGQTITITTERWDSTMLAAPPRTHADSVRRQSLERAIRAAEQTDTILLALSSLTIHAGDSVQWVGMLHAVGRDKAGSVVQGLRTLIRVGPPSVVQQRGIYLIGIAPGRGAISVQASRLPITRPLDERPLTRIVVDVTGP